MKIQGAALHVIYVLAGLTLWIAEADVGLAQCDLDLLHLPVSLKPGQVKTPEFTARASGAIGIEVTVKNVLQPADLSCMMALSEGPQDPVDCSKESLIEAEWKAFSGGRVVAYGSSRDMSRRGEYFGGFYVKFIGAFKARKHEKYSLEIDFTKDGSVLEIGDPYIAATDFLPSGILEHKPDQDILYTTYLPLSPGHFRSAEFQGNQGLNVIGFRVLGRLATAKEFCLFGIQAVDLPKCTVDSVLEFEWTVRSEGKIVATGTSQPRKGNIEDSMYGGPLKHCGGTASIERDIGFFHGRKGQKFSIEVNVKKDGSELNVAYPTLSVIKGYPASAFGM
jgi:hypothetical protein